MTQRINYTTPKHMSLHQYHRNLIQHIEEAERLGKDMSDFNDELADVKYRLQRGDKRQVMTPLDIALSLVAAIIMLSILFVVTAQ